jgi:DNA modification methylase
MKPYYSDDLVTFYHGDCLEVTEWLAADVLVTDPPYGISWLTRGSYGPTGYSGGTITNVVKGDANTEARDAAIEAWGDKPRIVFGSWKMPRPEPVDNRLIWHKAGMPPGPLNAAFMSQDEEIYITGKGFIKTSPPLRSVIKTSEHRPTAVHQIGHPTPKPVGLMEILIGTTLGVVADPFAGSGATLIAARNLGRKSIGVELEERYCELIATRLSQQTFDLGALV